MLDEECGINGTNPTEGLFEMLQPQIKLLVWIGQSGMRDWQEIVAVIEEHLSLACPGTATWTKTPA